MGHIHIHLLSDSTGETLENMAKAAVSQFEGVEVIKHFWPMVRSDRHLNNILEEISVSPGLVLFTIVNLDLRHKLETACKQMGIPAIAALDEIVTALSAILGKEASSRPGRQHKLNAAYFDRMDAIQYTLTHDDGIGAENWEEADIILVGVSRTSKTPTSIYLANRGLKVANMPIVPESPPPMMLFTLKKPLIIGLVVNISRLIQVRRNRLLSLNQKPSTDYVDEEKVKSEVHYARRMFSDNGWPILDVSRRSIEESAAAIIQIYRKERPNSQIL